MDLIRKAISRLRQKRDGGRQDPSVVDSSSNEQVTGP